MMLAVLAAAASCTLPTGWAEVTRARPRFVVLGEVHGTQAAPAFVGDLACALATRRQRVLVAVELNSDADPELQRLWAGPATGFADRLRTSEAFRGRDDGVGSVAMLELLDRLHRLRLAGAPIAVVAFNSTAGQAAAYADQPGQGPHEAAQAANIRRAAQAGRYDRVLVLTGNAHARRVPVEHGGVTYRSMAMQLATGERLVALNLVGATGASWSCQLRADARIAAGAPIPADAVQCGPSPLRGIADRHRGRFVSLGDPPDGPAVWAAAYDGYGWVGAQFASPPAAP